MRTRRSLAVGFVWVLAVLSLVMLATSAIGCATARSAGDGWEGFGAGNWPGANWRPYASTSPFNQLVGNSAVHPDSSQLVAAALQWGAPASLIAGTAGTPYDYGHPVYYAQPSDQVYVLRATEPWGPNPIEGMHIRVPARAQPAAGGDHHMTIVTPNGWEYDLWGAQPPPLGGGTLTFAWGGRIRIDGSGLGGHATASHFGNLAGVIRPEELAAGRINHALFVVLRCTGTGTSFGYGVHRSRQPSVGSYVYPAEGGGNDCGENDRNLPPMGTRFQLAMSDKQIVALPVPFWKKAILLALARYGGYVGDTGGPGFGFVLQSSSTYTSFGAPDPFVQLARRAGIKPQQGLYTFDLTSGVDWQRYLRVLVPPSA